VQPSCSPPTQDYITGPRDADTWGYFGIDEVTGEGYALSTDAWADAPEEPVDGHCIDSWTLAPVGVPVAGLTPYPADVRGQPDWAAQVVITPVAMLTVGDVSAATAAAKYDAAYAALNVNVGGGLYGDGMINSDPQLMLGSGDAAKVGAAVGTLAASAKVLGTLSVARALYECRDGSEARLSNELFIQVGGSAASFWGLARLLLRALLECCLDRPHGAHVSSGGLPSITACLLPLFAALLTLPCQIQTQWTQALIKPDVLASASKLTTEFSGLCLETCAGDAAGALAAINKQLSDTAVRGWERRGSSWGGEGSSPAN
jgi:hypothetical protein